MRGCTASCSRVYTSGCVVDRAKPVGCIEERFIAFAASQPDLPSHFVLIRVLGLYLRHPSHLFHAC
jgi:hypothetical protein